MQREHIFGLLVFTLPVSISIPILMSVAMASSYPRTYFVAILLLLFIGFVFFLKAKLSLIKQGRLLSFGTKGMSKWNRLSYFCGYFFMLLAVILSMGFLIYSKTI
ncbi:MAG: hypothetical protein ACYC54_09610 [Sedimentisphaerales bacterium]